uniref:Uncharacterized protein n=1 Tax=Lygus hesperus TaxID=30085 RepID=A0A146LJU8_LYGHE
MENSGRMAIRGGEGHQISRAVAAAAVAEIEEVVAVQRTNMTAEEVEIARKAEAEIEEKLKTKDHVPEIENVQNQRIDVPNLETGEVGQKIADAGRAVARNAEVVVEIAEVVVGRGVQVEI